MYQGSANATNYYQIIDVHPLDPQQVVMDTHQRRVTCNNERIDSTHKAALMTLYTNAAILVKPESRQIYDHYFLPAFQKRSK